MRVVRFMLVISVIVLAVVGSVAMVHALTAELGQAGNAATGTTADARPADTSRDANTAATVSQVERTATTIASPAITLGDGVRGKTRETRTQTLQIELLQGQAVVGQSYGFNGKLTGCRVWLVAGPFRGNVTVTDGEYFAFADMRLSAAQQNDLLQQAAQKQAGQGYGCSPVNQHVDVMGGV
jgi:hypothetical protein